MKVISIINYKGGVGKTTITSNLASDMVSRGKKVLVIDLDPQTNLTFSYIKVDEWSSKYEKEKTIKYWFDSITLGRGGTPSFNDIIVSKDGLDIICSHLGLIDVDIELASGLSSGTQRQYENNFVKTYSYIRNELDKLKEKYDVVLFDCPPNFSIVTKNAIIASDYYIVPAKMDFLSTLGINQLKNHIKNLCDDFNHFSDKKVNPTFLGVVATMIQFINGSPIKANAEYIGQLKRNYIPIFESMIRENKTLFANASEYLTPVVCTSQSNITYRNIVTELKNLTDEVMGKAKI